MSRNEDGLRTAAWKFEKPEHLRKFAVYEQDGIIKAVELSDIEQSTGIIPFKGTPPKFICYAVEEEQRP